MEPKNATTLEGVSTETARALIAQATASGLSIDDYLRNLLGLNQETELSLAGTNEQQSLTAIEPIDEFLGVFDSREPFERKPRERDAFGKGVIAKLEKQGIKLP
jgi:hypothetical protein